MTTSLASSTFATGANPAGQGDQQSGVVCVPFLQGGNIKITVAGDVNGSNSVRLQRSVDNGVTWSTVADYTSAQSGVNVAASSGQQYRFITIAMQPLKTVNVKVTASES